MSAYTIPSFADIVELPVQETFDNGTGIFSGGENYAGDAVGNVLLINDASATATFAPIYVLGKDEKVSLSYTAFHGWLNNGKETTVSLVNSEGQELVSYAYSQGSCEITSVKIGGTSATGFTAFNCQCNATRAEKNANGFDNKSYQGYIAGTDDNAAVAISIDGEGKVEVSFNIVTREISKTFSGQLPNDVKKDLAGFTISCPNNNADRAYAIDNFNVTSDKAGAETVTTVSTVGELLKTAPDTDVKFEMKGLTVTAVPQYGMKGSYVEDATGAVLFDMELKNTFADLLGEGGEFRDSIALSGTLYARYVENNGIPTLTISEETGQSTNITATRTEVVPTETTVKEAKTKASLSRFVVIKDAEMSGSLASDDLTATQDGETIRIVDTFFKLPEDFTTPGKALSIKGVISSEDGGETYVIYPVTADAIEADPSTVVAEKEVADIASLVGLAEETQVKLTLTNAKVITVSNRRSTVAYVEDATGAVALDNLITRQLSAKGLDNNKIVNGTVYASYSAFDGTPTLSATAKTAMSELTATATTVEPTEMSIADANKGENINKYVIIKNADLTGSVVNGDAVAKQGTDEIGLFNAFNVVTDPAYETPAKAESITAIIGTMDGKNYLFLYGEGIVADTGSGIDGINANGKTGHTYYNLNGQRISKPTKGLFIQDGKKKVLK